ncbi:hypothetical protein GCM10010440_46650 [Kitasatospora cinereorecta]
MLGEAAQPAGAARTVRLVAGQGLVHEGGDLQADPVGSRLGPLGLLGAQFGGGRQVAAVGEHLGEPEDRVHPQVGTEAVLVVQREPQLVDGGHRVGEQRRAAQFVQHLRAHLLARRLGQGALEAALGGLRGADPQVLVGGPAQLADQQVVALGDGLQQVPGGGDQAAAGVLDGAGGDAVHGGLGGGRDALVDRGADQRVDELQPPVGQGGEHPVLDQRPDRLGGLLRALGGDGGGQLLLDVGAQQCGRPGVLEGDPAELLQPVLQGLPLGRRRQVAQARGGLLHRIDALVAHLAQQRDGVVRGARGDRPDLAAERVVRVVAELVADQLGHRVRAEGVQLVVARGHLLDLPDQPVGLLGELVPVRQHHQDRQLAGAHGEGGEPGQRLPVGPVQVVDDDDQRRTPGCELGEHVVQAVAHALRVDPLHLAGRRGQSDGRADDAVPVAEDLVALGLGELAQHRHQQLAQHAERLGALALAAAGEEHRAGLLLVGQVADLVQHRGLAHAGRARVEQQLAGGHGAQRPGAGQPGERRPRGLDLRLAFVEPSGHPRAARPPAALSVLFCGHHCALHLAVRAPGTDLSAVCVPMRGVLAGRDGEEG